MGLRSPPLPLFRRAIYFARVGRLPAVLNFSINALIGLILFGSRELVPWTDAGSVGADLLVAGCIVATISAWAAAPRVERDAKAGQVAGRASSSLWRFLPRGRIVRSVLVGVFVALAMLLVIVPPCESAFPDGINGLSAALFKGLTSLIAGHLAIVISGNRVLVGAPDRTAEWDALPTAVGVPLAPIAKACLAGTSRARGASVAPTWRLTLEGDVSDADIRESFARMAQLVPVCRSIVQAVDGLPDHARDFVWFDTGRAIDVSFESDSFESVRGTALNHHLDLFRDGPVRVSVSRDGSKTHLFVQQHHGIADGRAFIRFLTKWGEAFEGVRTGEETAESEWLARPEDEAFGRTPGQLRAATWRGTRRHIREWRARRSNPPERLVWNTQTAAVGGVCTVHVTLPAQVINDLRELRAEWGTGTNAVLTAAYVRAGRQLHIDEMQHTPSRLGCELVAETRPRDGSFSSFANHLSVLFVQLEAVDFVDLKTTSSAVQARVRAEVESDAVAERALFRGWAAKNLPMDEFRRRVLEDVEMQTQMGFSNLTALTFPELKGDGWRVTDVRVTTPTLPPHAVMLTAVHYADAVTFNFNFDPNVVEESFVRRLATGFVAELHGLGAVFEVEVEISM